MDSWILWYLCFRIQRNACSVVHALRQLRSWARSLCPCCATTGIWSDSAESRAGAAVAVYRRSLLPFVPQRQIPMVLPVQTKHTDSATAVVQLVDAPVVQVVCQPVVVHDRGSDYAHCTRDFPRSSPIWCLFGVPLSCSVLSRIRVRGSCWTFSAPLAVFRSWCRLGVVTRGSLASCTLSTLCWC